MSVPDAIAKVLRSRFLDSVATEKKTEDGGQEAVVAAQVATAQKPPTADLLLEQCPDCGSKALAFESGCVTCRSCGFSKCS